MKNIKLIRKVFTLVLLVEFFFILVNFWMLVEKMSYDICGSKCEVENINFNKKIKTKKTKADSISIPRINVNAPIIFNSGITESEVLNSMLKGVVFYSSSDLPSEMGTTILLGHSSNYLWVESDYNNVFALLPELEKGNKIYLYYQSEQYQYEVYGNKIIRASEWQEIKNPDYDSGLVLITCWPLGSNLKRFIIYARRIN